MRVIKRWGMADPPIPIRNWGGFHLGLYETERNWWYDSPNRRETNRLIAKGKSVAIAKTLRARKQQIVAILGMSLIWPSIHNQLLYPITFAFHKEGMPSLYAHFALYSIVLLAMAVGLALMRNNAVRRLLSSGKALAFFGAAGAAGIALIVACDFSSMLSSALLAVGIALAATYVPVHFAFWSTQIIGSSEKRAAFDLMLSYLLFCGFTALRIGLGVHSWPVAIAFPAIAGMLAPYALRFPQKKYALSLSKLRDLPLERLIPAALFIYVADITIWLLNPECSMSEYPTTERALMYVAVGIATAVLAVIYRPKSKLRANAFFIAASLCVSVLIAGLLISGLGVYLGYGGFGNYPVLAGKILMEMAIWLMVLISAQLRHLGIVRAAAAYLVFVIGASNAITVGLMFWSQGLAFDRMELPVLEISIVSAFAVLIAVNAIMAFALSKNRQQDAAAEGAPSCETEDSPSPDDEIVVARMAEAYRLSAREADTLRLAIHNMSSKEMAEKLFVAESTVNSHLKSIYRKADVHSKRDLAKLAEHYRSAHM